MHMYLYVVCLFVVVCVCVGLLLERIEQVYITMTWKSNKMKAEHFSTVDNIIITNKNLQFASKRSRFM